MNNNKTLIVIIITIVFFILLVATGVLIGFAMILSATKPTPAPVAPVVEQPINIPTVIVSKFATDAGIIKLKDDLKNTQTKIDTMDLFEQQITPPVFDLNISIAPQL